MDTKGDDESVCFHLLSCLRVDLVVENFRERKVVCASWFRRVLGGGREHGSSSYTMPVDYEVMVGYV